MFKRKKEILNRNLRDEKEPKSRAKRVRMLLKVNRGLFKDKEAITDFKEPVVMLIRRSRAVEIYQDASKGNFVFKHSDGYTREIYLEPSYQLSFDYGKKKFKGYICYEDNPLPLPENPLVSVGTINDVVEKSNLDIKRLNNKTTNLKIKAWWKVGMFVLLLLILLILWRTHSFEKIIGMITGNPYTPETASVINTQTSASVEGIIKNNSLDIVSTGGGG